MADGSKYNGILEKWAKNYEFSKKSLQQNLLAFESYYGRLKFSSGHGCWAAICTVVRIQFQFPKILSVTLSGELIEVNLSVIILLAIGFFLACGETNFSRNVKNIPNIMSWIVDVLCCRRWSKLLLIFLMCGSFQACNICKRFWKIVKAFVYYSFVVMSLFKIYFFSCQGWYWQVTRKELTLMKALNMLH